MTQADEPTTSFALAALNALHGGEPVASAVVIRAPALSNAGARVLVWHDRCQGSLGDLPADAALVRHARALLDSPREATTVSVSDSTGKSWEVYLEAHRPPPELVIVGAGHIARPLASVGALLGFVVSVLDDRPEMATAERFPGAARVLRIGWQDPFREIRLHPRTHLVLVTRGHKYDFAALAEVLRGPVEPAYIGMVGSQRRVRATWEQLVADGISRERLARIHAPIGLDIGAQTPEEIAVAIAAELVQARRGGTGVPLRERARVAERWIRTSRVAR